jgi:hypothetical protein
VVGTGLLQGGRALARSSFDARGTAPVQTGLGQGAGQARGAGGYLESYKNRVQNKVNYAQNLKPTPLQLENAENKAMEMVVKGMNKEEYEDFKAKANKYADTRDMAERGEASKEELKKAQSEYSDVVKKFKMSEKLADARKKVGSENPEKYADTITSLNLRNVAGVLSGVIGIGKADKEAASRIRGRKGDVDKLKDILAKTLPLGESDGPAGAKVHEGDILGPSTLPPERGIPPGAGGSGAARTWKDLDDVSYSRVMPADRGLGHDAGGSSKETEEFRKAMREMAKELGAVVEKTSKESIKAAQEIGKKTEKSARDSTKDTIHNFEAGLGNVERKVEEVGNTSAEIKNENEVHRYTEEQKEQDKNMNTIDVHANPPDEKK